MRTRMSGGVGGGRGNATRLGHTVLISHLNSWVTGILLEDRGQIQEMISCDGYLLGMTRLEVLEFNPNLPRVADFHFKDVHPARGGAFAIADLPVDRKLAEVQWANKAVAARNVIDKTAGVWTNDIERLNCFFAGASQINRADRHLGKFGPGIDMVGDDAKYAGD